MVALANLVHVVVLAGAALLLVSRLGLRGYGWAEVVALPTFFLFAVWFHVYIGRGRYAEAGVWLAAWALPLFSWQVGPWVWLSIIVPLTWSKTRRELLQNVQTIATVLRRRYKT